MAADTSLVVIGLNTVEVLGHTAWVVLEILPFFLRSKIDTPSSYWHVGNRKWLHTDHEGEVHV